MSDTKKDSSRALPAKGTASSIYTNNNTIPPVYQAPDASTKADWQMGRGYPSGNQGDVYNPAYLYGGENYHKALHDAVTCALRARAGKSLSELSEDVVKTTNGLIKWVRMNEALDDPKPGKKYGRSIRNWVLVRSIDPVQAAELVFACEHIRMVCTKETIRSEWVVSKEFCEYMAYQALVKWDRYYELPEPAEAVQLKREWVLGNDTVAEFWEDFKDSVQADFLPNDYLSERYADWLRTEHPGMTSPMSNKALTSRIAELACSDGEWMQDKGADGKVLKTPCEKWCSKLYANDAYNRPRRRRGLYRTKVFEYCRANNTTPADLGSSYEAVRASLGIVSQNDD